MLLNAHDVLKAMPVEVEAKPEVVVMKIRSLEEVINDLSERIQKAVSMSFREFSRAGSFGSHKEEKVNVIVSFLAMLELVRQGIIHADQGNDFEEISLAKVQ
jgi:chromatin segregation and condensation protein Rec8/ScpA/Scc1 (kleisin family)